MGGGRENCVAPPRLSIDGNVNAVRQYLNGSNADEFLSEEELNTLRRVAEKIPPQAFAIAFIESIACFPTMEPFKCLPTSFNSQILALPQERLYIPVFSTLNQVR